MATVPGILVLLFFSGLVVGNHSTPFPRSGLEGAGLVGILFSSLVSFLHSDDGRTVHTYIVGVVLLWHGRR